MWKRSHCCPPVIRRPRNRPPTCRKPPRVIRMLPVHAASGCRSGAAACNAQESAGLIDGSDPGIRVKRHVESACIEDLGHEVDVRQGRTGTECGAQARASARWRRNPDGPSGRTRHHSGPVLTEALLEIGQRAGIVERMDVAGDEGANRSRVPSRRRRPEAGAARDRSRRDTRGWRAIAGAPSRRCPGQAPAVAGLRKRRFGRVLALQQVHGHRVVRHLLQVEAMRTRYAAEERK